MSRKFCCLYDVLLSIGVPPVQKPIVSDKMLDSETDFFKGKTVRIVDDIIICGTTLWKAKDKLLNDLQAKQVKTSVFCVNDKYWVEELIKPDYKAIVLSNDRALTFCSSIVRCLAIAPRPYATEFPYFLGAEIKNQYWHQLISDTDWNVYDITDKFQEENEVSNLTYFPSETIAGELKTVVGEDLFNLIDIAKVRVYAKNIGWGIRLSVLPIITLKPLPTKSVKVIFDTLIEAIQTSGFDEKNIDKLRSEFRNSISQLRFIQYFVALILASKFKFSIERILGSSLDLELSQLDVELLFGKWNLPMIKALANLCFNEKTNLSVSSLNVAPAILHWENTELSDLVNDEEAAARRLTTKNHFNEVPRNFFSDFSEIFLSLYYKKELPSRILVKEAAIVGDWNQIKKIDRLETGITWTGILEYLKQIFDYTLTVEVKNILSLVLDYAIDKGICVPVTRYNNEINVVFRAYRHGEDVLFSEQETELCGLAIENAQKAMSRDSLSRIFLEKLLVLFIKIGASQKILQSYYGVGGQDGVAKIGFYLQGAVAKFKKGTKYRADNEIWLTQHLLEKNVIKIAENNQYAFSEHYDAIQIATSSRNEAQKFGYYVGLLHKGCKTEKGSLRLTDDDLVFLTSCFRPRDVAAALLVELDIYTDKLFPLIEKIAIDFEGDDFDKQNHLQQIWRNIGFTALNSLHKKSIGWAENGAERAISKGAEIFDQFNLFPAKLDWDGYWASQKILKRPDEEMKFNELILQMSSLGHRLLFNLNLLEIFLAYKNDNRSLESNEKLRQNIDKFNNFYTASLAINADIFTLLEANLCNRLKQQVANNFAELDEKRTFKFIFKQFYELAQEVSKLLSAAERVLTEFEQVSDGTKYYDLVIYYDVVDSTATECKLSGEEVETYRQKLRNTNNAINNSIAQMQRLALKDGEEIFCWNGEVDSHNDGKYVFFSSERLRYSIRRVRQFLDRFFAILGTEGNVRMIVAPTNAFYTRVFKRLSKNEVEGDEFWEHFSRIQKQFKSIEKEYAGHRNLVLVIGNESKPLKGGELNLQHKLEKRILETDIAGVIHKTKAELWRPK